MKAIERLRGDHSELRQALDALGHAVDSNHQGVALRKLEVICRMLGSRLWQHIRREELLATLCSRTAQRLVAVDLDRLSLEHHEELEHLRAITPALSRSSAPSLVALQPQLERFAELLERHMAAQEARLFPMMEGVLLPREILRGSPADLLAFLFHRPGQTADGATMPYGF